LKNPNPRNFISGLYGLVILDFVVFTISPNFSSIYFVTDLMTRLAAISLLTMIMQSSAYLTKRRPRLSNSLRSEEHTSELQSRFDLVCRLLREKNTSRVGPCCPAAGPGLSQLSLAPATSVVFTLSLHDALPIYFVVFTISPNLSSIYFVTDLMTRLAAISLLTMIMQSSAYLTKRRPRLSNSL